jgi:hypothetical protein
VITARYHIPHRCPFVFTQPSGWARRNRISTSTSMRNRLKSVDVERETAGKRPPGPVPGLRGIARLPTGVVPAAVRAPVIRGVWPLAKPCEPWRVMASLRESRVRGRCRALG